MSTSRPVPSANCARRSAQRAPFPSPVNASAESTKLLGGAVAHLRQEIGPVSQRGSIEAITVQGIGEVVVAGKRRMAACLRHLDADATQLPGQPRERMLNRRGAGFGRPDVDDETALVRRHCSSFPLVVVV